MHSLLDVDLQLLIEFADLSIVGGIHHHDFCKSTGAVAVPKQSLFGSERQQRKHLSELIDPLFGVFLVEVDLPTKLELPAQNDADRKQPVVELLSLHKGLFAHEFGYELVGHGDLQSFEHIAFLFTKELELWIILAGYDKNMCDVGIH